jgi:acetamidase/formamidase
MDKVYLFSVNPSTPPSMKIQSGDEFTIEVSGAFDDVSDIESIPTPFTPECEGHPLAPISGPVAVQGAEPGDSVVIELEEITPHGIGQNAILKKFGVLHEEFADPRIIACPIRDGKAWFGDRIPIPLYPNLGTISTMPPEGYKPSYAGPYGGDFDQRDVGVGCRLHLPVMVPDALVFFADPHAVISDGIISGTGVECAVTVKARIALEKGRSVRGPVIEHEDTIQIVGTGPSMEEATHDASQAAVDFVAKNTNLNREEAYMLLGIVGELRVGTSPRPIMAARLIISREILASAGYSGAI